MHSVMKWGFVTLSFEFFECLHVCLLNESAIEDTPPNLHVEI